MGIMAAVQVDKNELTVWERQVNHLNRLILEKGMAIQKLREQKEAAVRNLADASREADRTRHTEAWKAASEAIGLEDALLAELRRRLALIEGMRPELTQPVRMRKNARKSDTQAA